MRGVLGLVGQSMGGPKIAQDCTSAMLKVGTTSFTAPVSGYYKFVLKGAGGKAVALSAGGNHGGGSGAHCEAAAFLAQGQTVACVVGAGSSETDTTITLPGRAAPVVAGAGKNSDNGTSPGAGGIATGGDYMLNGSAGGGANASGAAGLGPGGGAGGAYSGSPGSGGAGAPGTLEFPGGYGAPPTGTASPAGFPGGGGGTDQAGANYGDNPGAAGVIFVNRLR